MITSRLAPDAPDPGTGAGSDRSLFATTLGACGRLGLAGLVIALLAAAAFTQDELEDLSTNRLTESLASIDRVIEAGDPDGLSVIADRLVEFGRRRAVQDVSEGDPGATFSTQAKELAALAGSPPGVDALVPLAREARAAAEASSAALQRWPRSSSELMAAGRALEELEERVAALTSKMSASSELRQRSQHLERSLRSLNRPVAVALLSTALSEGWARLLRSLPERQRARAVRDLGERIEEILADPDEGPDRWQDTSLLLEALAASLDPSVEATLQEVLQRSLQRQERLERDLQRQEKRFRRRRRQYDEAIAAGKGTVATSVETGFADAQAKVAEPVAQIRGERRLRAAVEGALVRLLSGSPPDRRLTEAERVFGDRRAEGLQAAYERVLGRMPGEKAPALLRSRLAEAEDPRRRARLIEALGAQQDEAAIERIVERGLASERWPLRAAAIAALARIPVRASVDALIEALETESGRLVEDLEGALRHLTGKSFNGSFPLWKDWWKANREQIDPARVVASPSAEEIPSKTTFYGITTRSERLLFVMDVSSSMKEASGTTRKTKLESAQAELLAAITSLPETARFGIVLYSVDAYRWREELVPATPEYQEAAKEFVSEIETLGGTNIYGALREAYEMAGAFDAEADPAVDTIFFLSDGDATRGEALDPAALLDHVLAWNDPARIVIHAIGLGTAHDAQFLMRLAEQTGGRYIAR